MKIIYMNLEVKFMAAFTGNRCITDGIRNEIPVELQAMMWSMIDEARRQGLNLDYLQIFELKAIYDNGTQAQEITHSQEQPRRKKKITVESETPIAAKIFVIDDDTYVTMLLSHEY
jgi:hypothetical protein